MATTTYSFADHIVTISANSYAAYTITGQGLGEITVSYANDNTMHDNSSDGSVMVSKIIANNGTAALTVQQTSELNPWLLGMFNSLYAGSTSVWASIQIVIEHVNGGYPVYLNGVSFAKRSDKTFQAQGQMYSWNFMAADIFQDGSIIAGLAAGVLPSLNVQAQILNNI